jgi:hypothetical protein
MSNEKAIEYQQSMKFGVLREMRAMKLFIERDYIVSVPNINARYDFVAEKDSKFIRVQVKNLVSKKTANPEDETTQTVWAIRAWTIKNGEKRPYSVDCCDLVVGISLDTDDFAIVPVEKELEDRTTEYRLSEHSDSMGREYLNSYAAIEK